METNIFIKLLKLTSAKYFFVIYFCGIWAFSSSHKHLLITLLRVEFVAFVLYFSIYFICVVLIIICFFLLLFIF